MPGYTKWGNKFFHVGKVVVIVIDLTIADAQEFPVECWKSKNRDVIDPFLGGTYTERLPNFECGTGNLTLKTGRRGNAKGEIVVKVEFAVKVNNNISFVIGNARDSAVSGLNVKRGCLSSWGSESDLWW